MLYINIKNYIYPILATNAALPPLGFLPYPMGGDSIAYLNIELPKRLLQTPNVIFLAFIYKIWVSIDIYNDNK